MSKLIYCATPSRLAEHNEVIMDFVTNLGLAPLHPFQAFPFNRHEGNPKVGRTKSMEYCLRAITMTDEFWMFGVSHGTLQEVVEALRIGKPIQLHFDDWQPGDSEWEKYYKELAIFAWCRRVRGRKEFLLLPPNKKCYDCFKEHIQELKPSLVFFY